MAERPNFTTTTRQPLVAFDAKVFQSKYFLVKGDSDCEGRSQYVVGYFLHEDTAKNAAQGKGGMGTSGYVTECEGLVVRFENSAGEQCVFALKDVISTQYENPENIRKRALSKLTDQELAVLGLTRRS